MSVGKTVARTRPGERANRGTSTFMPFVHYVILRSGIPPSVTPDFFAMHPAHRSRSRATGTLSPPVVLGALLGLFALALCAGVEAQALDTALEAGAVETGVLGEPQLIEADVGADADVTSITLFHRFGGEREYRSTPMRQSGTSGLYAASVPTADTQADRLEFYIVAEDGTGDALLRGNSFEPLVRELLSAEADLARRGVPPPDDPDPVFGRSKYLWYALGALAVGVLVAAAASDSDGGGSDESCGADGCNLTLTLPPPP